MSKVQKSALYFALVVAFISAASSALAQQTRTVKFESQYGNPVKGAICLVTMNGQVLKITTPSRVKLPLDDKKELAIDSLSCEFQGIKRQTAFFPDQNRFGSKIHGVNVDFNSTKAEFWFKKKNGGVALYTRGDEVITVR